GVLVESGNLPEAHSRYEEALPLIKRLADGSSDGMMQRNHLLLLEGLAGVERQTGQLQAARARLEEVVFFRRGLVKVNPSSRTLLADLARSLSNLADLLASLGDVKAGRTHLEESVDIARNLATSRPSSADAQSTLMTALYNLGDVLKTDGDLAAARARF